MKTKNPPKKKIGRPRTSASWEGISVRFQVSPDNEKERLRQVAEATGFSQAEFIRRATMEKVAQALKAGRIEIRFDRG